MTDRQTGITLEIKSEHLAFLIVFGSVFAVYAWTAYPTIAGIDSAELTLASYTLGTAHSPGYPLFTLLGKFFSLLPIGSIAYRVNLISVLAGAAGAGVLASLATRLARSAILGMAVAWLFAFGTLPWSASAQADVFALNTLLCMALCYASLRLSGGGSERDFYLAALVSGLGLSNQHTMIFFVAPLGLLNISQVLRRGLKLQVFIKAAGLFLLGPALYIYLPLAAARQPLISWGDASSWSGFISILLRRDFGTFGLNLGGSGGTDGAMGNLACFGLIAAENLLWVGLGIAALGAAELWRTTRGFAIAIAVAFVTYVVVFSVLASTSLDSGLQRLTTDRFWNQALIPVFIFLAAGFGWAARRLDRASSGLSRLLVVLSLSLATVGLVFNWSNHNQHDNTLIRQLSGAYLESATPGAVILATDAVLGEGARYLQIVEQSHTDRLVIPLSRLVHSWGRPWALSHFPQLRFPKGDSLDIGPNGGEGAVGYSLRDFVAENYGRAPIYTDTRTLAEQLKGRGLDDYAFVPVGLLFRVMRRGDAPRTPPSDWVERTKRVFESIDAQRLSEHPAISWERALLAIAAYHRKEWTDFATPKFRTD